MTTKELCISSFVWLASLALAPGCSLPRAVTGAIDTGAGSMDAFVSGTDAGPPIDTGEDAPLPDAFVPPLDTGTDASVPTVDAYVPPDAWTAPDAWTPPVDAWVPPAGDASTPCDRAYGGSVPAYVPCGATTATTCVFYVDWAGGSSDDCDHVCGTRCVSGVDNMGGTMCSTMGGSFACNHAFTDGICTCTP